MGTLTYEQRVNKQEKNRKIRNIIITVVILLAISGVIRSCMIASHNIEEQREAGMWQYQGPTTTP
jgi:cell division protein FtsB